MCSGSGLTESSLTKILILLTGGVHWIGGIQYTRNILRSLNLLDIDEKPEIVVRIGARNFDLNLDREFSQFPGVYIDGYNRRGKIKNLGSYLFRKITGKDIFREKLLSEECEVAFPVKSPELIGDFEKVYWIPDFQYKKFPEFFPSSDISRRDQLYDRLLKKASILVLSSESVKKDFETYFPEYPSVKIRILRFFSWFIDEEYDYKPSDICEELKIPEKYLYLPNQFFVHKKHDTVFRALGKLKKEGVDIFLVCTGSNYDYRSDAYYEELQSIINEYDLKNSIRFLGIVSRFQQIQIYRQAAMVIQPSKSEGWSTSVEDARTLGKDILMSDIETHLEQAPEYGKYFRLEDVDDCSEKLRKMYKSAIGYDSKRETLAKENSRKLCEGFARNFVKIMAEAHKVGFER